jgi:hypothetical protein
MPELGPSPDCVVTDVPATAAAAAAAAPVVGEVPEIAASAVLVASEELPVGSDVVKVRILNHLVVQIRTFWYYYDFEAMCVEQAHIFFWYRLYGSYGSFPSPLLSALTCRLITRLGRNERVSESTR